MKGSDWGLILRYYSGICLEGTRNLGQIAGLRADILIQNLTNTKQDC
jgi:hypothetical protein